MRQFEVRLKRVLGVGMSVEALRRDNRTEAIGLVATWKKKEAF
jgi:hypothetical protein